MRPFSDPSDKARDFASDFGINVADDLRGLGPVRPVLAGLDPKGRPMRHISDENGTDYYAARIDYYSTDSDIHASRLVTIVMPDYRTKLFYWAKGAAKKTLAIHQGCGSLILGNPSEAEDGLGTSIFELDAEIIPSVTLPRGRFYTIEAAPWSEQPLVLSELRKTGVKGAWEARETVIEPGQDMTMTPDGMLEVPDDFVSAQFN